MYSTTLHHLHSLHQGPAKLIDTGQLTPGHHHCQIVKVDVAPVSFQKWHAQDGVLLELTNDEGLTDHLITDSTSLLYYPIERNTRPVRQRAMLPFIWFQANPVPGTECVKQTPTQ